MPNFQNWNLTCYTVPDNFKEIAREAIDYIRENFPTLYTEEYIKPLWKDFTWESVYSDGFSAQVYACLEWLKYFKPIKTINYEHSAYYFKHQVERFLENQNNNSPFCCYIHEFAFIIAALKAGFPAKIRKRGITANSLYFGISNKELKEKLKLEMTTKPLTTI